MARRERLQRKCGYLHVCTVIHNKDMNVIENPTLVVEGSREGVVFVLLKYTL
jgi:hypothetical protein